MGIIEFYAAFKTNDNKYVMFHPDLENGGFSVMLTDFISLATLQPYENHHYTLSHLTALGYKMKVVQIELEIHDTDE